MKELVKNTSIMGSTKILTTIIGIARNKYLAVTIGPHGFGIYNLLVSFFGLFDILAGTSLGGATLKYMAEYDSKGEVTNVEIVFNFKFTELQACIGIEQMKKLQWRVDRKKDIYRLYKQELDGVTSIRFFDQDLAITTPWFIDILAEKRDSLAEFLKLRGIGTRCMYPPINRQNAYAVTGYHPVSENVGREGLWLPSASQLSDEQIKCVSRSIVEFYHA